MEYQFIKQIAALPFIDSIWLFGSRARGDNASKADIDLAIICPNADLYQWQQVLDIVENADTLLVIDCIRFDELALNDPFRANILRDKKVIYEQKSQ